MKTRKSWQFILMILFLLFLSLPPGGRVQAVSNKVGLVMLGSAADGGFNQMAHQGLLEAEANLGVNGTVYEATDGSQYTAKMQQCVSQGNGLCIGVGFQLGAAVQAAAQANPGRKFLILDVAADAGPANLRGIVFNEHQAGYLAGALAARMTQTDRIGGVGGIEIPPVIAFLDGYTNGAYCSNPDVEVWLNYTGTFADPGLGGAVADEMTMHKADVIFAAAGPTGDGAILMAARRSAWAIGVDNDQYLTVFGNGTVEGSERMLTSAMKRLDKAVYDTIEDYLGGTFTAGTMVYGVAEEGVGLAPYHEADAMVPQNVRNYIEDLVEALGTGALDSHTVCRPELHKTSPMDGSSSPAPATLTWSAVSGATSYDYCIDTLDNDACDTAWHSTTLNTWARPDGLAMGTTYYWQVVAHTDGGELDGDGGDWWSFLAGATFADVPLTYWAWDWIEQLYAYGITTGCGTNPLVYCPGNSVTRAQMAVFLERGIHGAVYQPPAGTGLAFGDVHASYWAAGWVEQLARDGITTGCGGGNYCPEAPVTRDQMAVFLLRAIHGPAYVPPPATGLFADVPPTYWAAAWIEQLFAENITTGCGGGNFCPGGQVTRDQMAVFLMRAFD